MGNLYVAQIGPAGFGGACTLTLVISLLYLAAMTPMLRRRMRLRYA